MLVKIMASDWALLRHGRSTEAHIVDFLEDVDIDSLTLLVLENVVECCAADYHVALIYAGHKIHQATGHAPQDTMDKLQVLLTHWEYHLEEVGFDESTEEVDTPCLTDGHNIRNFVSYIYLSSGSIGGVAAILQRFHLAIQPIAQHYEYPCEEYVIEGGGCATWAEQRQHLGNLLHAITPRFSDFLPLIYFLQSRPFLDCSSGMDSDIHEFDRKWDRWLTMYPLLRHILDPAIVAIELVPPLLDGQMIRGLINPLMANLAALFNSDDPFPLPSQHMPIHLNDPSGPPNSSFDSLLQCRTVEDAKTFAAILRTHFQNANNRGGVGRAVRIVVLNTEPRGVRFY